MAPDTDLIRDIGMIILGIIVFVLPIDNALVPIIAYVCVGYGVAHMLFRINLDKTTDKKK